MTGLLVRFERDRTLLARLQVASEVEGGFWPDLGPEGGQNLLGGRTLHQVVCGPPYLRSAPPQPYGGECVHRRLGPTPLLSPRVRVVAAVRLLTEL